MQRLAALVGGGARLTVREPAEHSDCDDQNSAVHGAIVGEDSGFGIQGKKDKGPLAGPNLP